MIIRYLKMIIHHNRVKAQSDSCIELIKVTERMGGFLCTIVKLKPYYTKSCLKYTIEIEK